MTKKVKTEKVASVYSLIKNAKYTKMSDNDKIAVWKIFKAIKPLAESFIGDLNDARQQLIPYDKFWEDLQKAREFEIARMKKDICEDMSEDEYNKFIKQLAKYNELVEQATKECGEKEVEIDFTPLTSDAFDKLRLSNDWNFSQADEIGDFMCES